MANGKLWTLKEAAALYLIRVEHMDWKWEEITAEFNKGVTHERARQRSAVILKYKQLQVIHDSHIYLLELKAEGILCQTRDWLGLRW